MLRLAWKSVLGNTLRLALTALAVVLGTAMVSGSLVLSDSLDAAFTGLLEDLNVGIDAYVRPAEGFTVGGGPPGLDTSGGATLPEELVEEVAAVEGVQSATGSVGGTAQIVGADGEPVGGMGPPTLAGSWSQTGIADIREGRAPEAPDEVAIDLGTVTEQDFAVGDEVEIVTPKGAETYELVGTIGFGDRDDLLGATFAAFTLEQAQSLFDLEGQVTEITVVAEPDADAAAVVDRLEGAVGGDEVEVLSVEEEAQSAAAEISEGLGFIEIFLLSFAGIALFVGAFIIFNTFTITVAQRTREFALLRAVGASAAQVQRAVALEALVVGVVAGTLGLFAGLLISEGIQALFDALGFGLPSGGLQLAPRTVIASYAVAVLVTLAAATLPARRASRVAPVAAMRGTGEEDAERIGAVRTVAGLGLTVLGVGLLLGGLFGGLDPAAAWVGGGAAALFLGVAALAPWLARPVAGVLGAALRSVSGRLARENARRNPSRTASTASALTIGVALVSFVSIFAASATASVAQIFEDNLAADFFVSSQGGFGALPASVARDVAEVEQVAAVSPQRIAPAEEDGADVFVNAVEASTIDQLLQIDAGDGALGRLDEGGVLVLDEALQARDLQVGDDLELTFVAGPATLEVVGTFASGEVFDGPFLLDLSTYDEVTGAGGVDFGVLVGLEEGVDRDEARAAIEAVVEETPGAVVQDQNEVLADAEDQVNALLNVLIGLLALALIIAVIGIVNTLALSVIERTREIGLLRAVGMSRRQVRRMVRIESVIVAVFGAALGVLVGAFFGWAMVRALADEGISTLVFPAGRLVVYLLVAAVAGVVAAVLPARRAARLDVLTAVAAGE